MNPSALRDHRAARTRARARVRGFTLIELVVTLTLVSVLAMVAVPLYEVTVTRSKESELRSALREMRTALDAYKYAADNGIISKGLADSGYPPTLKTLVEGVDTIATPVSGPTGGAGGAGSTNGSPGFGGGGGFGSNSGGFGSNSGGFGSGSSGFGSGGSGSPQSSSPASASVDAIPSHMVFLRQVPRDPFAEDPTVAPDQQWNLRAYGNMPGDFSSGADVYDVTTKSTAIGLNGIPYKDW